jgi:site-specific DNA recombinase
LKKPCASCSSRDSNVPTFLLQEIAGYEEYLDSVRAEAAQRLRFDLVLDQENRVRPKIEAAQARLGRLTQMDPFVLSLVADGGIRDRWASLPLAEQRRTVRAVMTPIVKPIGKGWRGRKGINWDRVEVVWF